MTGSFRNLPSDLKPRERLLRTGDPSGLSDEDLLAIILKTGVKGCDVWELSHRILCAFSSIEELVRADARTIEARIKEFNRKNPDRPVIGVGAATLVQLQAAFELSRRANRLAEEELRAKNLKSSSAAYQVLRRSSEMRRNVRCFLFCRWIRSSIRSAIRLSYLRVLPTGR